MLKSDDDKRKGLMSEALEKVLEYGKTEMNLRRIEAFVATDNPASYRLLEKFGFQKEAELKFRYQFGDEVDCDFMYSLIFLPRQLNNTTIVLDSQKKVYERKYELIVLFLFQHAIWSQE
jgi:L-amino acid N-acyltransferase YncA